VVQYNACHHGLTNWNGPYANAGIMAAFGDDFGIFA
jgi:hypothetical protein